MDGLKMYIVLSNLINNSWYLFVDLKHHIIKINNVRMLI